jgi:hypothetical protein
LDLKAIDFTQNFKLMKVYIKILVLSIVFFVSCERKIDIISVPSSINPRDINVLSQYLSLSGAIKADGSLPTSTGGNSLVINGYGTIVNTVSGRTTNLSFIVPNNLGTVAGYYIQVEGSNIYYKIPYNPSNGNSNILNVPIGIPSITENGSFCVNIKIFDNNNQVSQPVKQCINVVPVPTTINPNDVNTLSQYLNLPTGTIRYDGATIPPPTTGGPTITGFGNTSVTTSNGGTTAISFNIPSNSGDISGYYVQVEGSNIYYKVPYTPSTDNPNVLNVPVGIPTITQNGAFCINVSVFNSSGQVSQTIKQCVDVLKLGSGSLQINLTWSSVNSDIDLHVIDPSGTEIYYNRKNSSTGGQLDRDDTNGFGPENIYWIGTAPDGQYKVWVEYYGGNIVPTTCYVTINSPDKSKYFQIVLKTEKEIKDIVTINKQGNVYNF